VVLSIERIELAEHFLQEAVYQSRERQANSMPLESGAEPGGTCGLGEKASIELDLSTRGRELFEQLWPQAAGAEARQSSAATLSAIRELLSEWVLRQDALDRKRNHFMKDFRNEHGFDRAVYSESQQASWRAGLDAVNAEVDEGRRAAAERLLTIE